MGNPLEDSFNFVLDKAELWWASLRDTKGVATRLLNENPTDRLRIRAAASLWFSSAFLSAVVSLPAYSFYGLKLENASFQLSFLTFQYAGLLVFSWFLHRAFLLYKIPSRYVDTLVIYSVVGAALAPLNFIATLPSTFRILGVISAAKGHKAGPLVALGDVFREFNQPSNEVLTVIIAVVMPPVIAISMFAIGAMLRMFALHYSADEWRIVRSFAFAMMVLMPIPFAIIVVAGMSLFYVFVTPA